MYCYQGKSCRLQAHRGVASDCPENTMAAFRLAAELGYDTIELDPDCTNDGQFVVLHDAKLNRTGRNADGSALEESVQISEISFAQSQTYDFGLWFSEAFRGEKLPLLRDVMKLSREKRVPLKIDNKIEKRIPEKWMDSFYALIEEYEDCVGLTSAHPEKLQFYARRFPKAWLHYDGPITEETLQSFSSFGHRLTVWVPYQNRLTTWVKIPFASKELCALVKKYALLGIWIINDEQEMRDAMERFSPDVVETTGGVKPASK